MKWTEGEKYWVIKYGREDDDVERRVRTNEIFHWQSNDTLKEFEDWTYDEDFDMCQRVTIVEE